MKLQESERTEFKSIVVADLKKEIIAFANCDGGKIYIVLLLYICEDFKDIFCVTYIN